MSRMLAAVLCCAATVSAQAGAISISPVGGGITLHSKDLSGIAFTTTSPTFSSTDLKLIHDDINLDIATDGCVTFILADVTVGASTKLAFMALVDDETGGAFSGFDASLSMTTTGHGANLEWINDNGSDITGTLGNTHAGSFRWDSGDKGDAFAWSNLILGDVLSFRFDRVFGGLATSNGLIAPPFQFLSWNGTNWVRVHGPEALANGGKYDFTSNHQFGFTATVIPLPMPVAIAAGGLALVFVARRSAIDRHRRG